MFLDDMEKKIGITWQLGSGFGRGVFGINFALQLIKNRGRQPVLFENPGDVVLSVEDADCFNQCMNATDFVKQEREKAPEKPPMVDFPVFYCGGNHFQHSIPVLTQEERRSVIFFENSFINPQMLEAAKVFTRIYAGSKWNAELLNAKGFQNVQAWAQGINFDIFHPSEKKESANGKFRVFTGGKLEFRKGQDIVIAAFKIFNEKYPDSELVASWRSPWEFLGLTMGRSTHVKPPVISPDNSFDIKQWLTSEGIPDLAIVDTGAVPNYAMGEVIRSCDAALFTNRAEGGTNLVAMEAIACGIPTILSNNTGHLDITEKVPCYILENQSAVGPIREDEGTEGWGESSIDETVAMLEKLYLNRDEANVVGTRGAKAIQSWTWENKIGELMEGL